ncbi:Uma2 family endonuclease [Gloeocapsopsis crepidinum LEGE 06123]|uniref:Uma2 family endonuclease n=1 Tax=Gloeocapsopsis crepidinum LEGE 06123 TaxID=588587 RepID=A0ABR9UPR0_9CHRO|nr:Uma2 family endonuclease [Gloeocapsopsis crepidinum LEGE 06123]
MRKYAEYASLDIPEYWIIAPKKERIWISTHAENEEGYEKKSSSKDGK